MSSQHPFGQIVTRWPTSQVSLSTMKQRRYCCVPGRPWVCFATEPTRKPVYHGYIQHPAFPVAEVTEIVHLFNRLNTDRTKGAFRGARGAIQAYGSLGSLKSSLSFVCGSHNGSTWSYTTHSMISMHMAYSSVMTRRGYEWLPNVG